MHIYEGRTAKTGAAACVLARPIVATKLFRSKVGKSSPKTQLSVALERSNRKVVSLKTVESFGIRRFILYQALTPQVRGGACHFRRQIRLKRLAIPAFGTAAAGRRCDISKRYRACLRRQPAIGLPPHPANMPRDNRATRRSHLAVLQAKSDANSRRSYRSGSPCEPRRATCRPRATESASGLVSLLDTRAKWDRRVARLSLGMFAGCGGGNRRADAATARYRFEISQRRPALGAKKRFGQRFRRIWRRN